MNRTGLVAALIVAIVVGTLFAMYPQLDIKLSAPFFNPNIHTFEINAQLWSKVLRGVIRVFIGLIAAPAFITLFLRVFMPQRRAPTSLRAALFLVITLAVGPGLLANVVLKDHWGRARPIDVTAFDGPSRFTAWWDPSGPCPNNCSFLAGEPSGAFWTFAPAALAPPQWRAAAYGAVIVFGAAVGVLRMSAGAHFFTDVVFAGVFTFLVVWTVHGLMYRWRSGRGDKESS